jgi:hypothetical protein
MDFDILSFDILDFDKRRGTFSDTDGVRVLAGDQVSELSSPM